jgi:hypothetical protein
VLQLPGQPHRDLATSAHHDPGDQHQAEEGSAPTPNKPKPGRYAFNFSYGFPGFTGNFPSFTGTLSGTIDKPNGAAKPRSPRSQGTLIIDDLDSPPGQWNCSTEGRKSWGGLPLTAT